jgi:hypothetical protein
MIFRVLVALSQVGVSLGTLLADLGIAGFIVGFALQDTFFNFTADVCRRLFLIPCNMRFLSTYLGCPCGSLSKAEEANK